LKSRHPRHHVLSQSQFVQFADGFCSWAGSSSWGPPSTPKYRPKARSFQQPSKGMLKSPRCSWFHLHTCAGPGSVQASLPLEKPAYNIVGAQTESAGPYQGDERCNRQKNCRDYGNKPVRMLIGYSRLNFARLHDSPRSDVLSGKRTQIAAISSYLICACDWLQTGKEKPQPMRVGWGTVETVAYVSRGCVAGPRQENCQAAK